MDHDRSGLVSGDGAGCRWMRKRSCVHLDNNDTRHGDRRRNHDDHDAADGPANGGTHIDDVVDHHQHLDVDHQHDDHCCCTRPGAGDQ